MTYICITLIVVSLTICYTLIKFKTIDINKLNSDDYVLITNYIDFIVISYGKTVFLSNFEKAEFIDNIKTFEKEVISKSIKDIIHNYISNPMKVKIFKYFNTNSLSVYMFNLLKGIRDVNIK